MHIAILHHNPITHPHQSQSGASIRLQHLCSGLQTRLPTLAFFCNKTWKETGRHTSTNTSNTHRQTSYSALKWMMSPSCHPESHFQHPCYRRFIRPRLLENLFESTTAAAITPQAIARSDAYLIAHKDQRDHWQALMRVMGVDDIDKRTLITPLGLEVLVNKRPDGLHWLVEDVSTLAKPVEES